MTAVFVISDEISGQCGQIGLPGISLKSSFFFFKEGNRHEIERKWETQFSLACSLEHCRVFPIESDYK